MGGDERGPVCVLRSRGYLKGLILSQLVRDFREDLPSFIQAFIDSIHHTSEGGGLINSRSSTWGMGAASGGALHRFSLVRLLAGVNQPYHHTISHALILLCCTFLCEMVTIARIAPPFGGLLHRASPSAVSVGLGDCYNELRRTPLPKLSKKSGRHQDEVVDAYQTAQSGLISLRYASDFLPRDTTERLLRQFL